jgi:hypothetical protein
MMEKEGERTMTDRINIEKIRRVTEVIVQLNKELAPLFVRAVLIDPITLKEPLTNATRGVLLNDILTLIHSITSLVVEQ